MDNRRSGRQRKARNEDPDFLVDYSGGKKRSVNGSWFMKPRSTGTGRRRCAANKLADDISDQELVATTQKTLFEMTAGMEDHRPASPPPKEESTHLEEPVTYPINPPQTELVSLVFGIPGPLAPITANSCIKCMRKFRRRVSMRPPRVAKCSKCGCEAHLKCLGIGERVGRNWVCEKCDPLLDTKMIGKPEVRVRPKRKIAFATSSVPEASKPTACKAADASKEMTNYSANELENIRADSELRLDLARWSVAQCSTFFSTRSPQLSELIFKNDLSGAALLLISRNQFLELLGLKVGVGLRLFAEITKWRRICF